MADVYNPFSFNIWDNFDWGTFNWGALVTEPTPTTVAAAQVAPAPAPAPTPVPAPAPTPTPTTAPVPTPAPTPAPVTVPRGAAPEEPKPVVTPAPAPTPTPVAAPAPTQTPIVSTTQSKIDNPPVVPKAAAPAESPTIVNAPKTTTATATTPVVSATESAVLTNATKPTIPPKPAGQQRYEWNGTEWVMEPYGSKRYEWNGSTWVEAPGSEYTWNTSTKSWEPPAMPTDDPGTFTMPDGSVVKGMWKLYPNTGYKRIPDPSNIVTPAPVNNGSTGQGDGTTGTPFTVGGAPFTGTMNGKEYKNGVIVGDATTTGTPSTSVDVLKSMLVGLGYPSKIVDSSVTFLNKLLTEGLDYDNAVSVFLNSKDYTFKDGSKIQSPFYTEYGYLNEGLDTPKSPDELFNAVEGYKQVKTKYNLSDKYITPDSIKKYIKNNVDVATLDQRANTARLMGITADPFFVQALQVQGFVKSGADLTDFFMDPTIGKEQLESNKATAAFTAEALRRAPQQPGAAGVSIDTGRFRQLAASMQAKGYSAAEIAQTAAAGYETMAQQLPQLAMLSGAFEKGTMTEPQRAAQLQQELESEQYLGMASKRRKMLEQQNINIFGGAAGRATTRPGSLAGLI